MATLREIADAGYSASPSSGFEQFIGAISGAAQAGLQGYQAGTAANQKNQKEQIEYYAALRDAGYSKDEATKRTNEAFTGGFMNKIFRRTQDFAPPTGPDKIEREQSSESLKADKLKAETESAQALAEERRAKAESGGLTPAQQRSQRITKNNALQMIRAKQGYSSSLGGPLKFKNEADMRAYLRNIKGLDASDPDIESAIRETFRKGWRADVQQRVDSLRGQFNDEQIAKFLKEKKIDPTAYLQ